VGLLAAAAPAAVAAALQQAALLLLPWLAAGPQPAVLEQTPLRVAAKHLAAAGGSPGEPQGPTAALDWAELSLAAGQVPVAVALALAQQQRWQPGGPVAALSAAAAAAEVPLVAAAPALLPLLLPVTMALRLYLLVLRLLVLRQGQLQALALLVEALPITLLPWLAAAPPVEAPQQLAVQQQAQALLLGLVRPSGRGAAQTGQPLGPAAGLPHLQGQLHNTCKQVQGLKLWPTLCGRVMRMQWACEHPPVHNPHSPLAWLPPAGRNRSCRCPWYVSHKSAPAAAAERQGGRHDQEALAGQKDGMQVCLKPKSGTVSTTQKRTEAHAHHTSSRQAGGRAGGQAGQALTRGIQHHSHPRPITAAAATAHAAAIAVECQEVEQVDVQHPLYRPVPLLSLQVGVMMQAGRQSSWV
jgi:hypothetical protein